MVPLGGKPRVSDEMRRTLFAAVHESVCGTFETCRPVEPAREKRKTSTRSEYFAF
ncbi:hypothetical protein SAMN05443247_03528 [Bradyrhizobium erythrophlei]|jgi:hypothetical protein|nr:hypothetical protein SAMN05443247_03528 [Bradyrhizobium erythrophlei]